MKLSWYGLEQIDDGIRFEDMGCGCCSYSPTMKGEEAKKELTNFIEELETLLVEAVTLLSGLSASKT